MRLLYLAAGRDLSAPSAAVERTLNIVRAVAGLGVEVTLAAKNASSAPQGVRPLELDLQGKQLIKPPFEVIDNIVEKAERVDLIHECVGDHGGIGIRVAALVPAQVVLEIATPFSLNPSPIARHLANWNLRRQVRAASAIITQTPAARNMVGAYAATPVYVVGNGAEPGLFTPEVAPARLPVGPDRPVIAFWGGLAGWHGVEELIEAGAMLLTAHPTAFFLFVGGTQTDAYESLAAQRLGEGNYHFTGDLARDAAPSYLAAADLLAAPFSPKHDRMRGELFLKYGMWWSPANIFECMAMGKPIVASAVSAVAEYISHAGIAVPPGEPVAFARAASRLLDDPELAETLGRQARERLVRHYTWENAAKAALAAYEKVLAAPEKASATR